MRVPTNSDNVTIIPGAHIAVSQSQGAFSLLTQQGSYLTIQLGDHGHIGFLQILNANGGGNSSNIGGAFNVNAGTSFSAPTDGINLTGTTVLAGGIAGGNVTNVGDMTITGGDLNGSNLTNTGKLTISGGIYIGNSNLTNAVTGTMNIVDDGGVILDPFHPAGGDQIFNFGTLNKSGGTGTFIVGPQFIFNNEGVFNLTSGNFSITGIGGLRSGTLNVAEGSIYSFDGPFNGNDTLAGNITGTGSGHVDFNSGFFAPQTPVGGDEDAFLNFPSGMARIRTAQFDNRNTRTITNQGFLEYVGASGHRGVSITNLGTMINSSPTDIAATFLTNGPTGVLDLQTDAGIVLGSANAPGLINFGTFRKSAGSGTSVITAPYANRGGTIDIRAGTISLRTAGVTFIAGPLAIATGATLDFQTIFYLSGTLSSTGGGKVMLTSGGITGVPSLESSHGTVPGVFDFSPDTLFVVGGTIDPGNTGLTNLGDIYFQGNNRLNGLTNAGTLFVDDGPLYQAGLLHNLATGTLNFTGDTAFTQGATLTNDGLLLKSGGMGTLSFTNSGALVNHGTIEVSSGTLVVPGGALGLFSYTATSQKQINADETFKVDPGATLLLDQPQDLVDNRGTVILGGAGSLFPALSTLKRNFGTTRVLTGASYATAGTLTNSGTLSVGGHITVAGDLLEVAGTDAATGAATLPTLDFEVGAAPGTANAPSLTVSGRTTLLGKISAQFAPGYANAAGTTYTVAGFANPTTGSFSSTYQVGPAFSVVVNPSSIVLTSTSLGSADLDLASVSVPGTYAPAQSGTVTWNVTNLGGGAAMGGWTDSVYLSPDGAIGASAILLGRVIHVGSLDAGAGYTGTLTTIFPSAVGSYRVVVLVDSQHQVSDPNRSNNVGDSAGTAPTFPTLTVGTMTTGTIGDGQDIVYRLTLTAGQNIGFSGTFGAVNAADLYVMRGAVPTLTSFDESSSGVATSARQITIPVGQSGDYYVLVHGREGAMAGTSFSLTPTALQLSASAITPSRGGNTGLTTVVVSGSGFNAATTVSLVSGATTIGAQSVEFIDSGTLRATFDLSGRTAGSYDVVTRNGAASATLGAAFTVRASSSAGLVFHLVVPGVFRVGRDSQLLIQYRNDGDTDIAAPYIALTSPNGKFRLPGETDYTVGYLEVLGVGPAGAAGTLAPGASGTMKVYFQVNAPVAHASVHVTATVLDDANDVTYLDQIADALRPVGEPADAWSAIYHNFLARAGTTLGGFTTLLRQAATALGNQGNRTGDPAVLFQYVLDQAGDFGVISQRYTLGVFGRGQQDPYSKVISADSNGNVIITAGGEQRIFLRDVFGRFDGLAGDTATLRLTSGVYTLREATGAITVFNTDGTLNYYADPNGNRLTAGYSGGRLVSLTDSDGDAYVFAYNGSGRISQVTDPVGRLTTYGYDGTGELLTSITTVAGTTTYTYVTDSASAARYAVASITYPDGTANLYTYDAFGRLVQTTRNGGSNPVTYTYDSVGNATMTDAVGHVTKIVRGGTDVIGSIQDGLGNVARIAYDPAGRPTSMVTPGGFATSTTYDAFGNPTVQTDANGNSTYFAYSSSVDRLLRLTDAKDNATSYTYDANGNATMVADAAGNVVTNAYDGTGQLSSVTTAEHRVTALHYDAHHLVTLRQFSDGTGISYTYDAHRNLLTASDASGTVTYAYDSGDRLTSVTYPGGLALTYTYDVAGRRTRMVDQGGFVTGYAYDALGRLSQITDGAGVSVTTYTYDAAGNLSRKDNANGTFTTYAYDAAGRVVSLVNGAPGVVNSSFAYSFDADGHRTSVTTLDGQTTYAYDAAGQLTSASLPGGRTIAYAYDAAGNRSTVSDSSVTAVSYSANNLNEYVTAGGTTYTYDRDGNLLSQSAASGTSTYSYNARGQLATATTATDAIVYRYDALGDLIAITDNGVTTRDLLDPSGFSSLVGQFDASGNVLAHYIYGIGLASRVDAAGVASFYDFDGVGNTADLTGVGGAVASTYTYLPFGERLSGSAPAANPFNYAGQYGVTDVGGGMYFMRARFYSATLGRFTQRDPASFGGGDANLFRYAANDPVNHNDPGGELFGLAGTFAGFVSEQGILTFGSTAAAPATAALGGFTSTTAVVVDSTVAVGSAVNAGGFFTSGGTLIGVGTDLNAVTLANGLVQPALTLPAHTAPAVTRAISTRALAGYGVGEVVGFVTLPATFAYIGGQAILDARYAYPERLKAQGDMAINHDRYNHIQNPHITANIADYTRINGMPPSETLIDQWIQDENDFEKREKAKLVKPRSSGDGTTISSDDPNDIFGPAGFGAAQYVTGDHAFAYEVDFENKPTASAPAQTVVVTEQLGANLDWTTFELGDVGFGGTTITVPAGLKRYSAAVVLSDTLSVSLVAGFDALSGLITWTFTSLDPTTGDLPQDPLSGFLPPDDSAGDGAGFVRYSVQPKAGLPTGATVSATASIVFDTNAAIATPTYLNTLDVASPTSAVTALPAFENQTSFLLRFSASDDDRGSGIANYDVFVSTDGGAFAPFLTGTTATSATFTGAAGHTYAFYSVARDNVGNVEATPASPQAQTSIVLPTRTVTFSGKTKAVYTDALGHLVTLALSGPGSATLGFVGEGASNPIQLIVTGTTAKTALTVTTAKGAITTLSNVQVTGSLGKFTAPGINLSGTFVVAGTLGTLAAKGTTGFGNSLEVDGAALATSYIFGAVTNLALTSAAPIKQLTVASWTGSGDSLSAPSISKAKVTGAIDASLTLSSGGLSLGAFAAGTISGGAWSLAGSVTSIAASAIAAGTSITLSADLGTLSVKGDDFGALSARSLKTVTISHDLSAASLALSGTLGTLTVMGGVIGSQVRVAGNVGKVTVGGMSGGSVIFAGVSSAVAGRLPSLAEISGNASIASFTSKGTTPFSNAYVAAAAIGTAGVKNVTTANSGIPFGFATKSLKSIAVAIPGQPGFSWTSKKPIADLTRFPGDFKVEILS